MQAPYSLSIEEFNYELPDEKIAKYPLEIRDSSKLLEIKESNISDHHFHELPELLPAESLLVFNNTKVIRARMEFHKSTGARIEIFCLEPAQPADYAFAFASNTGVTWHCLVGNLKKWKNETLELALSIDGTAVTLYAEKISEPESGPMVHFTWNNTDFCFSQIIEHAGNIPIPPYLNRKSEESDTVRYQTIYSRHKGSVAAPTAGLHFTERVMQNLANKNIKTHEVTLHVGAGTFKPVQAAELQGHEMHTEQFVLYPELIVPLIENIGKITAVGTTTVRTLESLYWLGVKAKLGQLNESFIELKQWEAYTLPQNTETTEALNALYEYLKNMKTDHVYAHTSIIIAPGYTFQLIERLVTNFHQPKSTLLLLVSALIGEEWKKIYHYALGNNYRFLSYGDACLMHKKRG